MLGPSCLLSIPAVVAPGLERGGACGPSADATPSPLAVGAQQAEPLRRPALHLASPYGCLEHAAGFSW